MGEKQRMSNQKFELNKDKDCRYIRFYRENVHIIIYTANDVEFRETYNRMLNNSNVVMLTNENIPYYIGNLGNYTVALVKGSTTGQEAYMSCNATITAALNTFANTDYLVTIGVCGGFQNKTKIQDVVVAHEMINYESQKLDNGQIIDRSLELLSPGLGNMLSSEVALMRTYDFNVHYGKVLSGNKLVSDKNFARDLQNLHPDAIALDMEGYTIARIALEHKLKDWLFIKSVSDYLQEKNGSSFQNICTKNALTVLERLLSENDIFQRRKVKIFISGCLEDTNPNLFKYEKFVYNLTGELIKNGFCIKSGYGKCIGNAIVAGAYHEAIFNMPQNDISLSKILELYPFPRIQSGNIKAFINQFKTFNRQLLIKDASFSLFVFGENSRDTNVSGMDEEFVFAQPTFVLPIGGTNYKAKRLWEENVRPLINKIQEMNAVNIDSSNQQDFIQKIIKIIMKIQNKFFTLKI